MFPAEVDAWLGRKAQIQTGCQRDRSQAPAPSTFLERAPKLLFFLSPPPNPGSVVFTFPSPMPCTSLPKVPLNLTSPLRSSLPYSPLQCKQFMSPGHDCLLERAGLMCSLSSLSHLCKPFSFDLTLSPSPCAAFYFPHQHLQSLPLSSGYHLASQFLDLLTSSLCTPARP